MIHSFSNAFGFDAQGRYDGTDKYFFAYQDALHESLGDKGLLWVIKDEVPDPIRPDSAFARAEAGQAPLPDDYSNMRRYQHALSQHYSCCERALAVIKKSLGMAPTARVVHILESVTMKDREKAKQVCQLLLATYGKNTEASRAAIDKDINDLPIATEVLSANVVLTGLAMLNKILRQMGAPKSDAQLKTILFQKLHGSLFESVINEIDKHPEMTYLEACDEVRRVMNLSHMRSSAYASSPHHVAASTTIAYPGYVNPSPPPPPSPPARSYAFLYPGAQGYIPSSSVHVPSTPSYQANTVARSPSFQPTPCWNCQSTDHRHRDCPANHCRACGSWWISVHEPNYHHFSVCPQNRNPPQFTGSDTRRPFARPAMPNKRGRGSPTMRGRGRPGRGATIAAVQTSSGVGEEIYSNDYWDNYLTENHAADDASLDTPQYMFDHIPDEYGGGTINMMCSDSTSPSSLSAEHEALKVLQDSGANICAAPPILAQILGVPIHQWSTPFTVVFGNKSTATSHYYLELGPILDRVAIVDSCINTILSVSALNLRKYDVLFSRDLHCYVWDEENKLVIRQRMDMDNRLYYVDVRSFLSPYPNRLTAHVSAMRRKVSIPREHVAKVVKLHDCLHHAASAAVMARALRSGAWPNVDVDPTIVEQVFLHRDCVPCLLGKLNHLPRSMGSRIPPSAIATSVSVDFKPVTPIAIGGFIGFYLFVETTVLYKIAVLTKVHDSSALLAAVQAVHAFFARYGHRMRYLITDAGTVEHAKELGIALNELGICIDPAAPECQFQNNTERSMQTVIKGVGSMFSHQDTLSASFWGLALIAYISASNACPNTLSGDYSPWYEVTHRHPDINKRFKFYFGQPIVSVILKQQKASFAFAPHAEFGYAVGAPEGSNGATLVYIPSRGTSKMYMRLDVRPVKLGSDNSKRPYFDVAALSPCINEDGSVTFLSPSNTSPLDLTLCRAPWYPSQELPESDAYFIRDIHSTESATWTPSVRSESLLEKDPNTHVSEGENFNAEVSSTSPRPKRTKRTPKWCGEYVIGQMATSSLDTDMPTLKDAMASDEWLSVWQPACSKEFQTLTDMGVGEVVAYETIPPSEPIHPTKMILKKKRDAAGAMIAAKARLVVIGNWISGVFQSLFAPTVNEKSMKLLFALASIFGLSITGIDIKGAFLYPVQQKPVFISLPSRLTHSQPVYWKLKKTLYGLPESPAAFYNDISDYLIACGYLRTAADPCMFYKRFDNSGFIMMIVHVDDFAIASSQPSYTEELLTILRQKYTLTVAESLESFLGLHIDYLPDGSVTFTQPKRIEELISEYHCANVPYPTVPMASTFNDAEQDNAPPADYHAFMALLGKLIYIIKTRPDIAYAVNRLATRANRATIKDFNCLLRIVSYLGGTRDLGLHFKANSQHHGAAATRLHCWVDAAYASHPDSKSHTGYCFSLGGSDMGMFYSRSFKQTNVTLSSTECENAAAVEATKEIIWFRQLLSELGFPQLEPTIVFADNASMITLAEDYSGNHKRVKHYLTRVNFMIEQVRSRIIQLNHISSADNISDILTKPLGPADFLRLRPLLLGIPPSD